MLKKLALFSWLLFLNAVAADAPMPIHADQIGIVFDSIEQTVLQDMQATGMSYNHAYIEEANRMLGFLRAGREGIIDVQQARELEIIIRLVEQRRDEHFAAFMRENGSTREEYEAAARRYGLGIIPDLVSGA